MENEYPAPICVTNYCLAWLQFKKTKEYKAIVDQIKRKMVQQPYADNILRVAFDAGWGDKKIVNL